MNAEASTSSNVANLLLGPTFATLPSDILHLIDDEVRALDETARAVRSGELCFCRSKSRTETLTAYESSDPSLALLHTCKDIQVAIEDRKRTFQIPYCRLGIAQAADGCLMDRANVQ